MDTSSRFAPAAKHSWMTSSPPMDEAARYGPEDIRKIRGELSRAAFARALGVTPLTVYRWELPVDAPESRRPRGRAVSSLVSFISGNRQMPVARANVADDSKLWAYLGRIGRGEFRAVERELLALMASDELRTAAARAQAAVGLALIQRFSRDDLRGAFATLSPHVALAEDGELPADAAAWVHAVAAVIFSGFDGWLFDPGKVNAHVARAERALPQYAQNDPRAWLRFAELQAAFNLGEPELMRRALERAREGLWDATEPVLRCLAGDYRAGEAIINGQGSLASRRLTEIALDAGALGFPYIETRMYAFLGTRRLEEAQSPNEVLASTGRARDSARQGGLNTGFWSVHLGRVEGEALLRLARFDEARTVIEAGAKALDDLRWAPFVMGPTWSRLGLYTGRGGEVRTVGQRMASYNLPLLQGLNRAYAEYVLAFADWIDGDSAAAAARFDEAVVRAQAAGGWMFLQRECVVYGLAARISAGDLDGAEVALVGAERLLDRLPSAWWTALLRRQKGLLRCAQGRAAEGKQHLEAALGTFALAGDVPEATLSRRALALALEALGDAGAAEALRASEEELRRAGMVMPSSLRAGVFPKAQMPSSPFPPVAAAFDVSALVVPFQRLSVRGVGPHLLQRELVEVTRAVFPHRALCLEELDSAGNAREVVPGAPLHSPERFEFGDGVGRRLRLSISGPLSVGERAGLNTLTAYASMALEISALRGFAEQSAAVRASEEGEELPGFIAVSASLKRLKADLGRLSGSRSTVIITGESGTGKEVVARALHELSSRRERPYVAFNCAAVPRDLFEGQLFGYRKGAFTGATSDQPGVLRAALGGTVFLDEIGELPLELQPKLLRFLENGEILPLGETRPTHVDVRIVVATHRDLAQWVREGKFREDLFYRLHVVPLRIPPLRERPEDIIPLTLHFLSHLTAPGENPPVLAPDALTALVTHPWPGNVRELRNVIERAMAFAPIPTVITADHLRISA